MSKYTSELKRIVSIFHAYRNDIDIYVEEGKANRELYMLIIPKLLADSDLKVKDVYAIGNRQQIIDICVNDDTIGRKKLYIVNGEFEYINNKYMKTHNNLFYLDAFDLENKIIDEGSIKKLITEQLGFPPSKVQKNLNYEGWTKYNSEVLKNLFLHYSILHEIHGDVDFGDVNQYLTKVKNEYKLDTAKIKILVNELKDRVISQVSQDTYEQMLEERLQRWSENNSFLLIVSGKRFLLPLLQRRLEKIGLEGSINQFNNIRLFLVKDCNMQKLQKLKEMLVNVSA